MTTFETIELTDDVQGGVTLWERYKRWNAQGRCLIERYANSRTGNRNLNPSWSCSEYLDGSRELPIPKFGI